MPQARRAATLETAADYLSWRFYARRIKKTELDERSAPLLSARAELGAQDTFSGTPPRPLSIREGHESMRVGLSAIGAPGGRLAEFQWRFAMQDLLDSPDGYMPDAALEMGALRIRYDRRYNRAYFKEATLAHVLSLNAWDDWVQAVLGGQGRIEQAEEKGRQRGTSAIWATNAGAGAAVETLLARQLWYAPWPWPIPAWAERLKNRTGRRRFEGRPSDRWRAAARFVRGPLYRLRSRRHSAALDRYRGGLR